MSRVLARKGVTDAVLAALRTTGFPIGDSAPPSLPSDPSERHAGWNGQPNIPGSFYVPYAVLTPSTVTSFSGPVNDAAADVRVPYSLALYGINRGQVEQLGDRCRKAVDALAKARLDLGGVQHKVQQVQIPAVGGIARIDAADPPTFGEVDTLLVWLTK